MRDSNWDDPTLDVVDRERRLRAHMAAEAEDVKADPSFGWTLSRRFAVLVSVVLVAFYLVVWAGTVQGSGGPEGYVRSTDFVAVLTAARIIRAGDGPSLYDPDMQRAAQGSIVTNPGSAGSTLVPYDRPPFEALAVAPLRGLPEWLAFALWTLATGLAVGVAVGLMDGALPVIRSVGWAMSLAACSYLPVIQSLMLGQDVAFVLLGLCGTFAALKRDREWLAAMGLVLVGLRPQMLPALLLLLLLQRRFKVLAIFFAFGAALMVALAPIFGAAWPLQYMGFVSDLSGGAQAGAVVAPALHNWRGLGGALMGDGSPGLAWFLVLVLSLASVGALVLAWWRSRDVELDEVDTGAYEPINDLLWALAAIVGVLISGYLGAGGLALLVFPAWIIGAYATSGLWTRGIARLWIALLVIGYVFAPLTYYWGAGASNPAASIVPNVLLVALAGVLLAWQIASLTLVRDPGEELYLPG